jgi:hypothetical protein
MIGVAFFTVAASFWLPSVPSEFQGALWGFIKESEQVLKPAIGVPIGFALTYVLIFCCNLIRAPYHQRNESWDKQAALEAELQSKIQELAVQPLRPEMLQHHREIIDFIKTFKAVKLTVKQESLKSSMWSLPGGKAYFDQLGQVEVKLIVEQEPKWQLAKEHLETDRYGNS